MAKKPEKKKGARKSLIMRLCVFAFVLYAAVKLVDMQVTLTERKVEAEQLAQRMEELRIANKELERQIDAVQDDDYIERVARNELGYVYPEERVYIDTSGS